jgi:DNA gyrase/topoisomerase IV subunit B
MNKNKSKFIEETMEVAENDLDKLRLAPLMYVSRVGELGAIHLAKECINNCIDECININSPGENIYLYLNEDTNTFVAEDDGR